MSNSSFQTGSSVRESHRVSRLLAGLSLISRRQNGSEEAPRMSKSAARREFARTTVTRSRLPGTETGGARCIGNTMRILTLRVAVLPMPHSRKRSSPSKPSSRSNSRLGNVTRPRRSAAEAMSWSMTRNSRASPRSKSSSSCSSSQTGDKVFLMCLVVIWVFGFPTMVQVQKGSDLPVPLMFQSAGRRPLPLMMVTCSLLPGTEIGGAGGRNGGRTST
mmetsp:Transcript_46664/g.134397  ORF Transcript_46664/g.134397 Transcript_46664/m.134397 type:complete len:218 (-) Transcript_46664:257-910(-)